MGVADLFLPGLALRQKQDRKTGSPSGIWLQY